MDLYWDKLPREDSNSTNGKSLTRTVVDCWNDGPVLKLGAVMNVEQAWDLMWSIVGGAVVLALAVIGMLLIADVIRDKLYNRRMRRHFEDTRGRR